MMVYACQSGQKPDNQSMSVESPYEPTYDLNFLLGHFDPSDHPDFVEIQPKHSSRKGMYMQGKAYESFREMYEAAHKEGVELTIISAARNFDYQKSIWEKKWFGKTTLSSGINASSIDSLSDRAKVIMKFSAMPGASRHHWGTDIDINSLSNTYFEKGQGKIEFEWLNENARKFGYCRPYTSKSAGRTGYEEEKWHWSYLPLSAVMTRDMELLFRDSMLRDFAGSQVAEKLRIKSEYILGIDSSCLEEI